MCVCVHVSSYLISTLYLYIYYICIFYIYLYGYILQGQAPPLVIGSLTKTAFPWGWQIPLIFPTWLPAPTLLVVDNPG